MRRSSLLWTVAWGLLLIGEAHSKEPAEGDKRPAKSSEVKPAEGGKSPTAEGKSCDTLTGIQELGGQ